MRRDEALRKGVNVYKGQVTCAAVAQSAGEKSAEISELIAA